VAEAYEGLVYIAKTSAWTVAHRQQVREDWSTALESRQVATCPIVRLELLYAAQTLASLANPLLAG
jgi:predicted nucleic acid-binding protein